MNVEADPDPKFTSQSGFYKVANDQLAAWHESNRGSPGGQPIFNISSLRRDSSELKLPPASFASETQSAPQASPGTTARFGMKVIQAEPI